MAHGAPDYNLTVGSVLVGAKEVLIADRTYYVRTDGNDANNGLVDSAAGAFLTIQRAIDIISKTLDLAGYAVTVQIKDGTYSGGMILRNVTGAISPGPNQLKIIGNVVTPSNVLINSSGTCVTADGINTVWEIHSIKLQSTVSGYAIIATNEATLIINNLVFGACANAHILADGGYVIATGGYSVVGNAAYHILIQYAGKVSIIGRTVYFAGVLTFTRTVFVTRLGLLVAYGSNFTIYSGSVTGQRYYVDYSALIWTNGGGANYFPGTVAGAFASQGLYA